MHRSLHRSLHRLCLLIVLGLLGLPPTLAPTTVHAAPDDPTIVGGDPVPDPNPYVWQVSLNQMVNTTTGTIRHHFCGGSVITDRWILTAAHCVVDALVDGDLCAPVNLDTLQGTVEVIVGRRSRSNPAPEDIFTVNRCVSHPGYRDVLLGDDIALIELSRPIPNAAAFTIPLVTSAHEATSADPGTLATVTGWGRMVPGNSSSVPDLLQHAQLPILANDQCNSAMRIVKDFIGVDFDILPGMICAGSLESNSTNVCQGDSGGPLVVADDDQSFHQVGIVSFGHPFCNTVSLAGYTRVSAYIDWIQAVTGLDFTRRRAPDLVVDSVIITAEGDLGVRISNQGTARVALQQGFWVDLYIGPTRVPTKVNEIWQAVGNYGAVWGVDLDGFYLLPGESARLILGNAVYWPTYSRLPLIRQGNDVFLDISSETPLYVQVDSANAYSSYGAIKELHELNGDAYNNIAGPFFLTADQVRVSGSVMTHELYLPLVTGTTGQPTLQAAQPTDDKFEINRLSPLLNLLPARAKAATEE